MPGMIAFGRKWAIGSDDFVFPGIIEIFTRIIWLIFISVVYSLHKEAFTQCLGGNYLEAYCIGTVIVMCMCIFMSSIIAFISSRGSITNTQPRRKIVKVLYLRTVLAVIELIWNILGTYWAFGIETDCESHVELAIKITVIVFWILALSVFIAFLIVFGVLGSKAKKKQEGLYNREARPSSSAITTWERRCKIIFCCWSGGEKNTDGFTPVAELLAEYFKDVDLVPTDIAAGLVLVHKDQEKEISNLPSISYDTFTNGGSRSNGQASTSGQKNTVKPKPWMSVEMMTYYMRYAGASYGWPFYMFSHLCTGCCHLSKYLRCCNCCRTQMASIVEDNCCLCNTATIRKMTGMSDESVLIYADYRNYAEEIPFYVAIDKEKQSVVVAIRGTLSRKDAMTDLKADAVNLPFEGLTGCLAHQGILEAAHYIKNMLEKDHILELAFERAQGSNLVITGHSLGAGAAALLAVLLKPQYPDLMCFAFAPPGGLMSYEASQMSQEFICSAVLGKDVIARLSILSMYDLKEKTLTAIKNSDTPKFKILATGAWEVMCGCFIGDSTATERLLGRAGGSNDLEEALQSVNMDREQSKITHPPMYPPGQILHVLEVEDDRACCEKPGYYAEWSRAEDFVKEIILSPDMITDHVPDNLMAALEQLNEKNFTPRHRKSHEDTTVL